MPADQGWEQVAAEAERLCEAATPAPWAFDAQDGPRECTLKRRHYRVGRHGADGIALVFSGYVDPPTPDNAAFIARARSLVPELAALVRQQAAEVARLRVRLEAALASGAPHPDSARYNDLLFAVATKHPNETRHETAKRYIVEAESRPAIASDALAAGEAEG